MEQILVINPGSTSTKIALYDGENEVWKEGISHPVEELQRFNAIIDELDMRYDLVMNAVAKHGCNLCSLSAIVSRGGPIAPFSSGAYLVNQTMVDTVYDHPLDQHASILGAVIAFRMAERIGVNAYIYDAVSVDELLPECKITGLPFVERRGIGHNLNMRASAIKLCEMKKLDYRSSTILVAHLGGGITMSLHANGRIVDIIPDEEGSFSPERAGILPITPFIDLCYSGKYTRRQFIRQMKGDGGFMAWFGTNDVRKVQEMIDAGDPQAKLVFEAMALNVAKNMARLAPVAYGKIDHIVLTGGAAYSKLLTDLITERISFLAPVTVIPGENEMQALANGVLRVLRGTETANVM